MEVNEVMDICRDGIYVLILIAAPAMIASLVVGLIVSLFQALTQIQEQTLTFVPKVLAMLVVLSLSMCYTFEHLQDYSHRLTERIVNIQ
jgi:flagellar biosynthetic protein FliQ